MQKQKEGETYKERHKYAVVGKNQGQILYSYAEVLIDSSGYLKLHSLIEIAQIFSDLGSHMCQPGSCVNY